MSFNGSRMVLFAPQPSFMSVHGEGKPPKDTNGHEWSDYFYIRGTINDADGCSQVGAIPLKGALLEMPESQVLFHF